MNDDRNRQVWVAPKLEQIAIVDTANKAILNSEAIQPDGTMVMAATGKKS